MRLLIIGPQGAGKGTQAAKLCQKYGIPHVSTGDLFRANISSGTELGLRAKAYMDAGALVPDEVTQDMLTDRLAEPDAGVGFLLDGFPRTIAQAEWLTAQLDAAGTPLDRVIVLVAPDEVVTERMMARGRADDTPEAIRKRLDIYYAETQPLVDYYGELVVRVYGVGEVDAIHARIVAELEARADAL